jgi:CBS domain containing-hemolysin-like protein
VDNGILPLQFIGLGILFVLSSFFSCSETALTALGKVKLKSLLNDDKTAKTIAPWTENPDRILTTILVGNNVVNIAATALATTLVLNLWKHLSALQVAGVTTAVMAFLILLFGEVTPKSFARRHAEGVALRVINPLTFLANALTPIIKFLTAISSFMQTFARKTKVKQDLSMTEEEIKAMITVGEEEGVLEEEEEEMIHSIFEFGETTVQEVMVPRTDMVCIEATATLEELVKLASEVGHSRFPVLEKRIDDIVGIIHVKNVLKFWGNATESETWLREIMFQPYFVPETKKVNELLREFQQKKIHMAIVVDEYGGTAGVITLEDLIEEITGEIEDEYDVGKKEIAILEPGVAVVDAKVDIDEVNETLDVEIPTEGAESIGGFVLNLLGRVPQKNETVIHQSLKITVTDSDRKRLRKLKVEKITAEERLEDGEREKN